MEGIRKAGVLIGARKEINFIEGSNVTLTIDDSTEQNNAIDVTVSASGGGIVFDQANIGGSLETETSGTTFFYGGDGNSIVSLLADIAILQGIDAAVIADFGTLSLIANDPTGAIQIDAQGSTGISVGGGSTDKVGFYGTGPVTRPNVPASPTVQDVVDALKTLGLITQS